MQRPTQRGDAMPWPSIDNGHQRQIHRLSAPSGRLIWHQGIEPDVQVSLPSDVIPLLPETEQGMTPVQVGTSGDTQRSSLSTSCRTPLRRLMQDVDGLEQLRVIQVYELDSP